LNQKLKFLSVVGVLLLTSAHAGSDEPHGWQPAGGFVPDERTAVRVAEVLLGRIYGESAIQSEKPFRATLTNGVWTVKGNVPEGLHGGAAVIKISKKTCEVLFVIHEQ